MVRRLPSKQRNAKVVGKSDRTALTRLALLLFCGLVLSGGFLYACSLRISALRYGYQNETLRRERDRLLEEQGRFLLEREAATAPARLERAARQLGMQPMHPEQMDPLRVARDRSPEKESSATNRASASPATAKRKLPAGKTEVGQRLATLR